MFVAAALLALAQVAGTAAAPAGALVHQSHLFGLPDGAVGYVPASASAHPPLLVLLHGAGHRQAEMVEHFEPEAAQARNRPPRPQLTRRHLGQGARRRGAAVGRFPIANAQSHSFGRTPDADRVEKAIGAMARILPVDRARTVLAGFSDGATFALAMGMSRDHAFAAVIDRGNRDPRRNPARGRRVFVSHGRSDPILKFAVTCGDIVPLLKSEGAEVTFVPFDGGHDAPVWLKDTFLDAVFGPVAGSEARPLPEGSGVCVGDPSSRTGG